MPSHRRRSIPTPLHAYFHISISSFPISSFPIPLFRPTQSPLMVNITVQLLVHHVKVTIWERYKDCGPCRFAPTLSEYANMLTSYHYNTKPSSTGQRAKAAALLGRVCVKNSTCVAKGAPGQPTNSMKLK